MYIETDGRYSIHHYMDYRPTYEDLMDTVRRAEEFMEKCFPTPQKPAAIKSKESEENVSKISSIGRKTA